MSKLIEAAGNVRFYAQDVSRGLRHSFNRLQQGDALDPINSPVASLKTFLNTLIGIGVGFSTSLLLLAKLNPQNILLDIPVLIPMGVGIYIGRTWEFAKEGRRIRHRR